MQSQKAAVTTWNVVFPCRLADESLWLAHPMMFKPFVEHITNKSLEGQSSDAVLLQAQNLTEADMLKAEPEMPDAIVHPVKLRAVLEQCAPCSLILSMNG
jgi:hypothetical protein